MRKLIVLLFIIFTGFKSFCLDTLNTRLFEYAKNTPAKYSKDIKTLVDYLKIPTSSKRQVPEIFFYWITSHISYDLEASRLITENPLRENGKSQDPDTVLYAGKGVCSGYSSLFKKMCDLGKIKCEIIHGFARNRVDVDLTFQSKANHAWNAICIDEMWYLVDATWGTGYFYSLGDGTKFTIEIKISELFANPAYFVKTRIPDQAKWQLLDKPITFKMFLLINNNKNITKESEAKFNYLDSIRQDSKLSPSRYRIKTSENIYRFTGDLKQMAFTYYSVANDLKRIRATKRQLKESIQYYTVAKKIFIELDSDGFSAFVSYCNEGVRQSTYYLKNRSR